MDRTQARHKYKAVIDQGGGRFTLSNTDQDEKVKARRSNSEEPWLQISSGNKYRFSTDHLCAGSDSSETKIAAIQKP